MAQRPKLELNEGEEVRVSLIHTRPVSGKNGYGDYHMYTVANTQGAEFVFFAPDEIHEIISERKLYRGSWFTLRKSKGRLEIVLSSNSEAPSNDTKPLEDGYRTLMESSLRDAIEATRAVNTVPWSGDDIRSIAVTIFIQRARG